jgi:bifunctional DNA-binding transcriptional regulator/antitoxin component of YhaV-PrlF toxin-antitoxin module
VPTIDDIYGGNTLKAEDLPQNFRAVLRIESVSVQEFTDRDDKKKTERKVVLRFVGKDKGLALNITNANMMAEISGTRDYEKWGGLHVVLYRTMTDFGRERVPALRIDNPAAAQPPRQIVPPPPPSVTITEPVGDQIPITDSDVPF